MTRRVLVLAERRPGLTDDALRQAQARHAEMVRGLGDGVILGYSYGFAEPHPEGAPRMADLVVEVRVTSFEAYFAALETEDGKAAVAHAATYLRGVRFLLLDEHTAWG